MLVFLLVVADLAALDAFLNDFERQMNFALFVRRRGAHGDLQCRQSVSRITVRNSRKEHLRVFVEARFYLAEPLLRIRQSAVKKLRDRLRTERTQLEDKRTRSQRRIDEEVGIVGGRANQHDRAVLDIRQKDVLLGFVESVDFVDEKKRSESAEFVACAVAYLSDVGHARNYARKTHKAAFRRARDNFRQCRLAAAGRTIEDDVCEPVGLNHPSQQLSFAQNVILSHDFVEGLRAHARG